MIGDVVLAIDTSNYTTSVAIMSTGFELVANLKCPLKVKEGERGLRQSDAVFSHTVNLPELMKRAGELLADRHVVCVGVSERPRSVDGSYMPCFLAGVSVAVALSEALRVPLYHFSHQDGHIMAALYSSDAMDLSNNEFAAFHVSGGTTELVRVSTSEDAFRTELVGGTLDLNAGQLIDRIGVRMGLAFPAGAELEKLALANTEKIPRRKISVNGMSVNLSGIENIALDMYDKTNNRNLVAAFVLDTVGRCLQSMRDAYTERYGECDFVYAGGVMCNSIIKGMLSSDRAHFAKPEMSADNAVGIAALALKKHISEK